MTDRSAAFALAGLVALLACLARFVHLDADPYIATWVGYVIDEGRWNETARNFALFGMADMSPHARLHLLLSPAYQLANFVVFRLLGVDFWSARLLSAIAGSLVVLVTFGTLRRHVTPLALLVGVVLLGFEPSLLAESRLAVPELPSAFATLAAFLVLILARASYANAFGAGMLAALAIGAKATTILVMPIFPVLILCFPGDAPLRSRLGRAAAFVAGLVLVAALGLSAALAAGVLNPENVVYAGRRVLVYLAMTTPYVALVRFFDAGELEARNLMLLGLWLCSWMFAFRRPDASPTTVRLYIASALWTSWWLVAWSGNAYLPGRYIVHFVIPATINIMAGLSLFDRETPMRIANAIAGLAVPARIGAKALLVLPSAIFLAAIACGVPDLWTVETERLTFRVAAIATWTAVLTALAASFRLAPGGVAGFLAVPLFAACAWLVMREAGTVRHFWQFAQPHSWYAWVFACVVIAAVTTALARGFRPVAGLTQRAAVAALVVALLPQTLPALLAPTYSMLAASHEIGRRLEHTPYVRVFGTESLFLGNTLKFRFIEPKEQRFGALVLFEHGAQGSHFLNARRAGEIVRVAAFPIIAHPRYEVDEAKFGPMSVGIYEPMRQ